MLEVAMDTFSIEALAGLTADIASRFLGQLLTEDLDSGISLSELIGTGTLTQITDSGLRARGCPTLPGLPDAVKAFLDSPELENILFQLLAIEVQPASYEENVILVREHFDYLFKLFCGYSADLNSSARRFFKD